MQSYLACNTIGPSVLRKQGSAGVIKTAQEFLAAIDLSIFAKAKGQDAYTPLLDDLTDQLRARFHQLTFLLFDEERAGKPHRWGAARKCINLFMRDACYNRFLSLAYDLAHLEPWMEIPLDSLVAARLHKEAHNRGTKLPKWTTLIDLERADHDQYQTFARTLAEESGESLPALDMRLWMEERNLDKTSRSQA
jgi:hypothetical protein